MSPLEQGLNAIHKELMTMTAMVEEAIRRALLALTDRRNDLVSDIIRHDKAIDAQENRIDEQCATLIALQRPVASDLRLILTTFMVNNELERMGDHAKNIARAAEVLADKPPLPIYEAFDHLAELVLAMLRDSLRALSEKDTELAEEIRHRDLRVDEACDALSKDLTQLMTNDGSVVPQAVQALSAVHNLERIADLATNIAKDVIYFVQGRIARHRSTQAG